MNKNPADGERTARIGYEAQDKRAANLIYDLLIQGRLEWFKIADPEAGRVDDIQVATIDGELHAYQVKWAETTQPVSFADFTRSSSNKSSLIKQLADGWQQLKKQNPDKSVRVHLIHRCIPDYKSPSDHGNLKLPLGNPPPQKPNFQGFIEDCWEDKKWLNDEKFPQGWESALEDIRRETNLPHQEFIKFITASYLHFNYQFLKLEEPADHNAQRREQDINQLARLIAKLGGGNKRIIEVTRAELLQQLGWESRFEFRFKHEFPVDDKLYQPITQTVSELETAIQQFNSGYLALIGTPGSGKSTTLTQTLRYRKGLRIIRYYAYVPDSLGQQGRGEANSFLHDLHLALQRQSIYVPANAPSQPTSLEELRNAFSAQLGVLHKKWQNEQICTLIIVDGLDHIEREQSPERSFLKELPNPAEIPEGVLFILGSQTLVLNDLPPRVKHHLEQKEQKRTFTMHPLPKQAVFNIITASNLSVTPSYEQQKQIYTLSNGHPLALRYLLEKLKGTNNKIDFDELLQGTASYRGHIEENYQIYWDKLPQHEKLKELLALLARLRTVFNPRELIKWVGEESVKLFLEQARHYFREESATRWQFFHNSFRQFILTQTKHNIFGDEDLERHRTYHQRLAGYAAATNKLSPWSWEELYHRFGAEEWDKVLKLGTQDYFRQQFFNLRPLKAIFEDTALCLKAARIRQDGLAIIRIFLIEKELGDRDSNLGMSEVNLPCLLYELKGIDAAIHYVMDGLQLRVSEAEALRFVALLIEKGELQVAEMIFNAAEPLDITNGSTPIESIEESSLKTIQAWAQVVHYFRSLEKIFTVIKQLRADTEHLPQHENPEDRHKHVQQNVLMTLTHAIFDSNDENKLNQFKKLLNQHEDSDLFLEQLDFNICAQYNQKKDADKALERLLQRNQKTEFSDIEKLRLIEHLFHIRGDKTTAARWLANMCQPDLQEIELGEEGLSSFSFRICFNRLLALLGQQVEPVYAVPDSDNFRERGKILFERSIVKYLDKNIYQGHPYRIKLSDQIMCN